MKLKEILEIEKERDNPQSCRVVHLVQEGSFYRAYEWSAWLCVRYIKDFKPTHRLLKNSEESIVFVGFPVSSLERYAANFVIHPHEQDKRVDLIPAESLMPIVEDVVAWQEDFENWKACVPLTPASKKKLQEEKYQLNKAVSEAETLQEIVAELLSFPMESKSLLESVAFLAQMKQKLLHLREKENAIQG